MESFMLSTARSEDLFASELITKDELRLRLTRSRQEYRDGLSSNGASHYDDTFFVGESQAIQQLTVSDVSDHPLPYEEVSSLVVEEDDSENWVFSCIIL